MTPKFLFGLLLAVSIGQYAGACAVEPCPDKPSHESSSGPSWHESSGSGWDHQSSGSSSHSSSGSSWGSSSSSHSSSGSSWSFPTHSSSGSSSSGWTDGHGNGHETVPTTPWHPSNPSNPDSGSGWDHQPSVIHGSGEPSHPSPIVVPGPDHHPIDPYPHTHHYPYIPTCYDQWGNMIPAHPGMFPDDDYVCPIVVHPTPHPVPVPPVPPTPPQVETLGLPVNAVLKAGARIDLAPLLDEAQSSIAGRKIVKMSVTWTATSGRVNLQLDLNGKVLLMQAVDLSADGGISEVVTSDYNTLVGNNSFGLQTSGDVTIKDISIGLQ